MTSPGTNQGDFAQPLAGLSQQQSVSVSTQVSTAALKNVENAGTQIDASVRTALNFIDGTNGAVTVADNSGSDRVDVTVDVASSPTFSGTVTANQVVYNGMRAHRHPYATDRHIESGTIAVQSFTAGTHSLGITFTTAYAVAPIVVACTIPGTVGNYSVQVGSVTTSGASLSVNTNAGDTLGVNWIAEGH